MKISRPSPGLVLGALALVVASSGVGYAGGQITTADIRNNSIKSADIKNGSIKDVDIDARVLKETQIGKAYAYVTYTEAATSIVHKLDPKRTFGFSKVTHPGEGTFCLVPSKGVDLSGSPILVSVDAAQSAGTDIWGRWSSVNFQCPQGNVEIKIVTPKPDIEPDESSPYDYASFSVFAP